MDRFKRSAEPVVEVPSLTSHSRLRTSPNGGRATSRYDMVRDVLLTYLSLTLVEATLERALQTRRLATDSMSLDELSELASDAMVGLRLFVPQELLSRLMLDLTEVLDDGSSAALRNPLDTRGKSCPQPLVLLAQTLRAAAHGAKLTVLADDRTFPESVRAWCKKTGHDLVSLDSKPGYHEASIRKP